MYTHRLARLGVLVSLVVSSRALADHDFDWLQLGRQPDAQAGAATTPSPIESTEVAPAFGQADTWRWAVYAGGAHNFEESEHYNLHFSAEYFIADYFSVNLEFGALYFDQVQDTWGGNFNTLLRWHMFHGDSWTIFADAGAGLLATADDVPDDGTSFGFTPQAGVGATFDVGDGGARLITGLRWHHISNARSKGEENNPGRDALMAYVGLSFPWGN